MLARMKALSVRGACPAQLEGLLETAGVAFTAVAAGGEAAVGQSVN